MARIQTVTGSGQAENYEEVRGWAAGLPCLKSLPVGTPSKETPRRAKPDDLRRRWQCRLLRVRGDDRSSGAVFLLKELKLDRNGGMACEAKGVWASPVQSRRRKLKTSS